MDGSHNFQMTEMYTCLDFTTKLVFLSQINPFVPSGFAKLFFLLPPVFSST